jgi:hypothetical protein
MKDPAKISDFLERILPGASLTPQAHELVGLFQQWRWIAGERLSGHSVVKAFDKGNLIVDVDHPGWMNIFQMEENAVLERAKRKFPSLEIKRIRVRLVESLSKAPDVVTVPERESKPLEGKANPELLQALEDLKNRLNSKKG